MLVLTLRPTVFLLGIGSRWSPAASVLRVVDSGDYGAGPYGLEANGAKVLSCRSGGLGGRADAGHRPRSARTGEPRGSPGAPRHPFDVHPLLVACADAAVRRQRPALPDLA